MLRVPEILSTRRRLSFFLIQYCESVFSSPVEFFYDQNLKRSVLYGTMKCPLVCIHLNFHLLTVLQLTRLYLVSVPCSRDTHSYCSKAGLA